MLKQMPILFNSLGPYLSIGKHTDDGARGDRSIQDFVCGGRGGPGVRSEPATTTPAARAEPTRLAAAAARAAAAPARAFARAARRRGLVLSSRVRRTVRGARDGERDRGEREDVRDGLSHASSELHEAIPGKNGRFVHLTDIFSVMDSETTTPGWILCTTLTHVSSRIFQT